MLLSAKTGRVRETTPLRRLSHKFEEMKNRVIIHRLLLNGLKPYNYLTYILDEIRKMGVFPEPEEMDKLLPWSKDLPDEVRTKCKK